MRKAALEKTILHLYHSWEKDEASKSLLQVTVPEGALLLHLWVYLKCSGAVVQLTSYAQMLGA